MGSWNGTCMISNLHITAGTDVAVFILAKNHRNKSFCYGNAMYEVLPLPFYGKYDDYGSVDDCTGFGLNLVVETIRERLYKFGQGPNSCHDCEVNKENFDIDKLFEADHEDRLGIEDPDNWNSDEYEQRELERLRQEFGGLTDSQQFELDRLANKIKKVDTFRQLTHVIIHGDVFRAIMDKWYIDDYVGGGQGTSGYGNNYNRIYFADLVASIPEYIRRMKAHYGDLDTLKNSGSRMYARMYMDIFEWNDPCLAGRWMNLFKSRGESNPFTLIEVREHENAYSSAGNWDDLAAFAKEVLTAAWVNNYMSTTRKHWTQTTGKGGQTQDSLGYEILADAMKSILAEENKRYGEDEEEIDESDEVELGPDDTIIAMASDYFQDDTVSQ